MSWLNLLDIALLLVKIFQTFILLGLVVFILLIKQILWTWVSVCWRNGPHIIEVIWLIFFPLNYFCYFWYIGCVEPIRIKYFVYILFSNPKLSHSPTLCRFKTLPKKAYSSIFLKICTTLCRNYSWSVSKKTQSSKNAPIWAFSVNSWKSA